MVELLDSTLREGCQAPGVSFSVEQRLEVALLLDEFGVDFIDAGHPVVSKDVLEGVKLVAGQGLNAHVISHARACRKDVDAVIDSGSEWVGIFLGVNKFSLHEKVHCSKREAFDMVVDSVSYAKAHGLKVRYTPEDATRTEWADLVEISLRAVEAGADRISIADTVGVSTPGRMAALVSYLKGRLPCPLNVHCHNDLGLAVANSLAAYEAGVTLIDASVNGLGERAGITPLHEITVALSYLYGVKKWKLDMLPGISQVVAKYSGIPVHPETPLVGKYAFTHTADLHKKAVKKNPESYEPFSPDMVGRKRSFSP
ncbi:2-isopropylmalate synthase [uncultured archaeon]|nr:2-isopropylmalate synthase [uncultured archaeon]